MQLKKFIHIPFRRKSIFMIPLLLVRKLAFTEAVGIRWATSVTYCSVKVSFFLYYYCGFYVDHRRREC